MAGTRQYRRNRSGQFASSSGATVTTTGRAGGFASAAHRANVANKRAATAQRKAMLRKGAKYAATGVAIAGIAKIASKTGPRSGASRSGDSLATVLKKSVKSAAAGRI